MLRTPVAISKYGSCKEVKGVSKAHIPGVDHVLKKPHVSDCCYRKNGDFDPSYYDWLGAHKTEGERERE